VSDRILVTGANGFVGSALCRHLEEAGFSVRATSRTPANFAPSGISSSKGLQRVVLHDRSTEEEIRQVLAGAQMVVHLAARVHIMNDPSPDPLREFRRVNRDWTDQLARVAASLDVRRFVYLSSIKVNGEECDRPYTEEDIPRPQDPYGLSKWEAEQALAEISTETGMETVVVRSPLVYGPNVGGNFLQLLNALRRGIPFPLASVRNRRSLIYRGNLVDALTHCVQDHRAAGRTFLVGDNEHLSTPELIRRLGKAMGVKARLLPFPLLLLRWIGRLAGKKEVVARLLGSLQVDSSKIKRELDWQPPFSTDRGLAETAAWFCRQSPRFGTTL
jgi:nucleoside-diphosphate-sugar epimerase